MTLPKAVEQGLAHANQLLAEMQPASGQDEQQEAAPETLETDSTAEPTSPPAEAPTPELAHEAVASSEPVSVPDPETSGSYEALEQKHRTLQGMYRTQKLHTDRLQKMVGELQRTVESLSQSVTASAPAPSSEQPEPGQEELSYSDSDLGPEMSNYVRRMVRAEVEQRMRSLNQRVDEIGQQQGQTTASAAATRQSVFLSQLGARVPDWQEINVQEDFNDWLDVADPIYRTTRREALNSAAAEFDMDAVVEVFEAYKAETAPRAPVQAAAPKAPPAPSEELRRQMEPARSAPAAAPSEPARRVWTQAEIENFYVARVRGDYRGREQEADRVENEINQALVEGRIR